MITWALDRILKGDFAVRRDAAGNIESLKLDKDLNPLSGVIELDVVESTLEKLLPREKLSALMSLKERRTPQEIERALGLLFPPEIASRGAEELEGAEWGEVLMFVHVHSLDKDNVGEKIGELIIKEREGLSSPFGRDVETRLETELPVALPLFTARKYAKEVRNLFPKIVRRAGSLRLLPAAKEVPDYVCRCLIEASRCYVYGHFLASLFLCRSALGESVEDVLRNKGYEKDIAAMKDEGLKGILRLARDNGLMDEALYNQADDIRALANQAIHGNKLPTDDECKNAFYLTRGILQHLYA